MIVFALEKWWHRETRLLSFWGTMYCQGRLLFVWEIGMASMGKGCADRSSAFVKMFLSHKSQWFEKKQRIDCITRLVGIIKKIKSLVGPFYRSSTQPGLHGHGILDFCFRCSLVLSIQVWTFQVQKDVDRPSWNTSWAKGNSHNSRSWRITLVLAGNESLRI